MPTRPPPGWRDRCSGLAHKFHTGALLALPLNPTEPPIHPPPVFLDTAYALAAFGGSWLRLHFYLFSLDTGVTTWPVCAHLRAPPLCSQTTAEYSSRAGCRPFARPGPAPRPQAGALRSSSSPAGRVGAGPQERAPGCSRAAPPRAERAPASASRERCAASVRSQDRLTF